MEKKHGDLFYGLLTVKLLNPPSDSGEIYKEIKDALGIDSPLIDDRLGVLPQHMSPALMRNKPVGEEYFVVGVECKTLWDLVKQKHPSVLGCMHAMGYHGDNPPLHLKDPMPPSSPPRRKPGAGGPRF